MQESLTKKGTFCLLFLSAILLTGLVLPVSAQKQPFPDDWAKDAGPEPEEVPETDERGALNVALLPGTSPNASSCIANYEDRHSIEFLNDGWYNNPRSWILAGIPGWAEIDLGRTYEIDKVVIGSEHTANWNDRMPADFSILVATEYDEDSGAATWTEVYTHKGEPVHATTAFEFDAIDARWVRIDIRDPDGARIDEIEIYSMKGAAVDAKGKLTTTWGRIKM
ncbi:hypothetical protein GF312_12335 [Candidatus Poribacteria bacterium]|nr:hypothetical protein [Candidatus Poribacteria bacterium]